MTENKKPEPSPLLQSLIMWAALLAGQGLVVAVSQTAVVHPLSNPDQVVPASSAHVDVKIWYAVSFLILACAAVIPRVLLERARKRLPVEASLRERAKVILPIWLARWALLESLTMIGFVHSMLTTNPAAIYPFAALSLIGFVLTLPTEARMKKETS